MLLSSLVNIVTSFVEIQYWENELQLNFWSTRNWMSKRKQKNVNEVEDCWFCVIIFLVHIFWHICLITEIWWKFCLTSLISRYALDGCFFFLLCMRYIKIFSQVYVSSDYHYTKWHDDFWKSSTLLYNLERLTEFLMEIILLYSN
jgi:hypothetical protein